MAEILTTKPKILYVTRTIPCPPRKGSHRRVLNIARQLKKDADLKFVYVGPAPDSERVKATECELGEVEMFLTRQMALPKWLQSHRNRYKQHWPWFHSDKVTKADENKFHALRKQYDLVWFHTLTPADSFRQLRFEKSILDMDDLNHIKFSLKYRTEKSLRGKIADKLLVYKWRRWELKAFERFDWIAVCSRKDKETLGGQDNVCVIPNGYEKPMNEPEYGERTGKRIGFLGDLDYTPNAQALHWFAQKVWPLILNEIPDAELRVMGAKPVRTDYSSYKNFNLLGFVEDSKQEFDTWSALIVPLWSGGGTRLKILDAFSKKCPVVSTPVGAYGLNVVLGKHIYLAQTPEDFSKYCLHLLKNSDAGKELTQNAWQLFTQEYDWNVIGTSIHEVVEKAVKSRQR